MPAQSLLADVGRALSDLVRALIPRRFKYVLLIMDPGAAEGENSAMISNLMEDDLPELLHGIAGQLEGGLRPVETTRR